MSDPFRTQEYSVVQIHICHGAVAKRLASMEHEGDLNAQLFLTLHKTQERLGIVDERQERVLVPDKVEARDEVRELLLHRDAVLEVPLDLLGGDDPQDGVYDLRAHDNEYGCARNFGVK